MNKNTPLRAPLKSWDLFSLSLLRQAEHFTKATEIEILNEYKQKYNWNFDFNRLLTDSSYDALVLTNVDQEIQWVNKGFSKMTGYPASFSKGKTPKFLQGAKSSETVLKSMKKNIDKGINFKETIVNYRKNKEEYNCNIEIFPIRNENNEISHLLALEKEVYS